MKLVSRVIATCGTLMFSTSPAPATNPAMGLVDHPVYLGEYADPQSIPLAAVAVWHNYGFGIHGIISKARSFPDGPLVSGQTREFDMNLASVYDIEVLPEDPTQVPFLPVRLIVGDRELPAGARHTRTQALEATLWSLILLTPGSEKHPLTVKIESPTPEHQKLAGNYVMDPQGLTLVTGEIPGSKLVRDGRGVLSIVFQALDGGREPAPPADSPAPRLAFAPLLSGGGAEDTEAIALLPHWTTNPGNAAPLEFLWTAMPRAMNVFSAKRGENANPLHAGPFDSQSLGREPGKFRFYGSNREPESIPAELRRVFSAACHGAIVTLAITEDTPLEISFQGYPADAWDLLHGDGWEPDPSPRGDVTWRRNFHDTEQSILNHRLIPRKQGGWWLEPVKPAEAGDSAPTEHAGEL